MSSKLSVITSENLKLTRRLELGEFSETLDGNYMSIWLNLDAQFWGDWARYSDTEKEFGNWLKEIEKSSEERPPENVATITAQIEEKTATILELSMSLHARLWGCTPEEAQSVYDLSPPLFRWCSVRAFEMVKKYNQGEKKR